MRNVIVKPGEVWNYFVKNRKVLESEEHIVAENEDFGVVVVITNLGDLPQIIVRSDDFEMYSTVLLSPEDAARTVEDTYNSYLTEAIFSKIQEPKEEEDEDYGVSVQEDEIDDCIVNLLSVVSAYDLQKTDNFAEICEDLKEHILEYLYLKHGVKIYRPMFIKFDDGSVEYCSYPYDKLNLDNADNPIYKK